MTPARAIVFDAPEILPLKSLELRPSEAPDLEVEVIERGISRVAERPLWDGTMPHSPGLGDPQRPKMMTDWRA